MNFFYYDNFENDIEDIQRQKKVDKIVTPIVQTQVAVAVLLFAVTTFVFVMVMDSNDRHRNGLE